jgi:hypothetical protein
MSYPSLVLRFVKDQFDDYRESTIGGSLSLLFTILNDSSPCLYSRLPHTNGKPRGWHFCQI